MRVRPFSAAVLLAGCAATGFGLPQPPRPEHEVTAQGVVYEVPGMDRVTVKKNVPYKKLDGRDLRLDLYYPPDFQTGTGSPRPAVIFVNGVGGRPDASLKDWGIYQSWGRLVAASGWIGVTFESRGGGPSVDSGPDIADLLRFVRTDGARLGILANRVAAWMCSANVTSGLRVVMQDADSEPPLRAAVVYYGASDPTRIRTDLPVLLVKAGRDNPGLNARIDALAGRAAAANAPWTVVYAPNSHHAFDGLDETDESRRIVRETLEFFREYLSPPQAPAAPPSIARRALSHWFANEYPEAAAAYAEYVKSHPDDAEAWLRLGISQAHLAKASDAAASLEKARALGADAPLDLSNLACGYALLGDPEKAIDYLDRSVSAGYGIRSRIAADEELASLRNLDRFQKVLAKLPDR
ncbi:MAG TPA: tetratricopeptide repeat protein [Thermoanaerobaculia bacterium]